MHIHIANQMVVVVVFFCKIHAQIHSCMHTRTTLQNQLPECDWKCSIITLYIFVILCMNLCNYHSYLAKRCNFAVMLSSTSVSVLQMGKCIARCSATSGTHSYKHATSKSDMGMRMKAEVQKTDKLYWQWNKNTTQWMTALSRNRIQF